MSFERLHEVGRILGANEDVDEAALAAVASALLRHQFIYRYDHGMAPTYDTAVRFREYFAALFRAFGYEFVHDDGAQMVGSLPGPALPTRLQLRLDETLVLLVLRLVFQEEIDRFNARRNRTVATDSEVAMAKLEAITGRERPGFGRLRDILEDFQRRGLVAVEEAGERRLKIELRPALMLVASADYLARLEQFATADDDAARGPRGDA